MKKLKPCGSHCSPIFYTNIVLFIGVRRLTGPEDAFALLDACKENRIIEKKMYLPRFMSHFAFKLKFVQRYSFQK